ncbi:MAG: hypothetical protein COA38_13210 [Fluviicola sp.]|nr:MAG: hypothetical protein COA38_13210 [Fluviicola sp.]
MNYMLLEKLEIHIAKFPITGLFMLLQFYSIGQMPYEKKIDSTVTIELSIPHGNRLRVLNDCSSLNNDVFIIIRNDTDSIVRFYENWNSYGYYNFTFEIKTTDSTYTVSRPHKLWYRNFPTHHNISLGESIVFQFDLIDTVCASRGRDHGISVNGWIGIPNKIDTALIRVIYSLPSEYESYPDPMRRRLDYLEYLDNKDELNEIEKTDPTEENKNRIYIFSQTMMSEWRKVVIAH